MESFKLTYDKKDFGENFALSFNTSGRKNNYYCTCGSKYESSETVEYCKDCNSKIFDSIYVGYSSMSNGDSNVREGYYCDKAEFTNKGGFLLLKKIIITYKYKKELCDNRHSTSCSLQECDIKILEDEFIRIDMFYVTNRLGNTKVKGTITTEKGEERLLKTRLGDINLIGESREIKNLLSKLILEDAYNFNDLVWQTFNRYKYAKGLMDAGIINIVGNKHYANKMIEIYNNEEYRPFLMQLVNADRPYQRMNNITCLFNDRRDGQIVPYLEKRILIRKLMDENVIKDINSYVEDMLADFCLNTNMSDEDFIAFCDLAQRQAFDISYSGKISALREMSRVFKEYDIPFDKKPKELMIYHNKMSALRSEFVNGTYYKCSHQ